MRHVGLLVLGSFINSLGTGLTAFGLAVIMLRAHGTASSRGSHPDERFSLPSSSWHPWPEFLPTATTAAS